jgi:hypothetical protein
MNFEEGNSFLKKFKLNFREEEDNLIFFNVQQYGKSSFLEIVAQLPN